MIEYIIWNYGSQIMLAVLCAVFGTLGFVLKKAYAKHANDATKQAVARFQKILEDAGIPATVRRSLGGDIDASCGQLRRKHIARNGSGE